MTRLSHLFYLLPLAMLSISLPAKADKVFLKATSSTATGNATDFVEGKVIAETKDHVTIRIEGG
ncbi:MAG: hypothetical protein GY809_04160, partial [Planctomycetes bacterium]|nr:hypothetical protein [Planctomycetota bacterium]